MFKIYDDWSTCTKFKIYKINNKKKVANMSFFYLYEIKTRLPQVLDLSNERKES